MFVQDPSQAWFSFKHSLMPTIVMLMPTSVSIYQKRKIETLNIFKGFFLFIFGKFPRDGPLLYAGAQCR
jgi:hypothetical protein